MKVFYWGLVQVNQAVISRWQSTCSLWYRDTMSMRLLKGGIHGPLLAGHWGHHYTTCGTCLPLGAVMSVRVDVSGQWHFQGNNPFLVNKHRRISCTIWLTWSLDMSDLRFQGQELEPGLLQVPGGLRNDRQPKWTDSCQMKTYFFTRQQCKAQTYGGIKRPKKITSQEK